MDPYKARYARETAKRTLAEAIEGADIFLGLSAPRLVSQAMVRTMAERPLILALANPVPEIEPEDARAARPDAIIATGRSDYPNQVNNVLCFPFIFRGALDVGATTINDEMKIACAQAIAAVARTTAPDTVAAAYGGSSVFYGPECIIPKPFDSRLAVELPIAVARAAMASGVATRPIDDLDCLPGAAVAVRVPLRADHEADLRAGARAADAGGVRRRRGGARAARRGGAAGRAPRQADPDRASRGGARAHRAPRAALQRRRRRRAVQSRERSALPRLRRPLSRPHGPARRDAGGGARDRAHAHHGDRRDHGRSRRGGRADRRADRPLSSAMCGMSRRCSACAPTRTTARPCTS